MKSYNTIKNALFIILTMMFFAPSIMAQENKGILKGKVTANGSQDILIGATIKISGEKNKFSNTTKTAANGEYEIKDIPAGLYYFTVELDGFDKHRKSHISITAGKTTVQNAVLKTSVQELETVTIEDAIAKPDSFKDNGINSQPYNKKEHKTSNQSGAYYSPRNSSSVGSGAGYGENNQANTESYAYVQENGYKSTVANPLSTFSVDVDAASYSNCRRFIMSGQRPEKGAVRVEEMINYFNYDYPDPTDEHPFSITTEVGECPWSDNKLVHIGLQGKRMETDNLPNSNLVFLIDVSGSMNHANKLPLLKQSFRLLVDELTANDKVSIVVYAGAAGLVLSPTAANNSTAILESLNNLRAGGSTAGGAGIELAYSVATQNFIPGGNNRIILATDGDFNIGMSSDAAMQELIEEKRKTGVFLTCLGFGDGNYKDSKMELLADKGNGNYAYIDNLLEAKKVLVTEIGATLNTLAKDVKIQVEFNPAIVESYRLVGYENRLLNEEDFNDDTKDAGEIGAGHSVTALYEVVLKGEGTVDIQPKVDPLKYQANDGVKTNFGDELLTVKFRYKEPDGEVSKLIERVLANKIIPESKLSRDFLFSAAVAEFGMILRDSEFKGTSTFDEVIRLATGSKGKDKNGYRAEFIKMADAAKILYK